MKSYGITGINITGINVVAVQDSPKHLLLRAYESVNEEASGDSGCEASPDA